MGFIEFAQFFIENMYEAFDSLRGPPIYRPMEFTL